MLEFLAGLADLLVWLSGLAKLWRWLTEERAPAHRAQAGTAEMARIRRFARWALGLWLAVAIACAMTWNGWWVDSAEHFFAGLAVFVLGPALIVVVTGRWRDDVVARLPG